MVVEVEEVLSEFSSLLRVRIYNNVYTTEDSVRYTLFASILNKMDILTHEVILEFPHPNVEGAEVDTYIPSKSNRPGLLIECKYDRRIPGGKNAPRTQKAGKAFNDIYRLTRFDSDSNINRWFVYLTDPEMATYLNSQNNGLYDFINLPSGKTLTITPQYLSSKSPTFITNAKASFSADIRCLWSESLPRQHELRVYEVSVI